MRMAAMFAAVLLVGVGGMAGNMAIVSSEPYPDPGTTVTFQVEGAPAGSEFRWTLGEHGTAVRSETWLRWAVPEGYHQLEVEAVREGKVVATAAYGMLADTRLGATRTVERESGYVEVRITVRSKETITGGLSIAETVPEGLAAGEAISDGDLAPRREDGKLVTGWWTELAPGTQGYFEYTLHGDDSQHGARLFGVVVAYIEGERVERPIGGQLEVR